MRPSHEDSTSALLEGRQAYNAGVAWITQCPYPIGHILRESWQCGWWARRSEAQASKGFHAIVEMKG